MASPSAPPPPIAALHGGDHRMKGRVFLSPPGPRRTPDHPPYAEMIQVALRALAEDGGSTAADISRRIAAVYLDLPWAHERLLPHYLGRLVATGDVFVASPGRFVLSSPPTPVGNADPSTHPWSAFFAVQPGGSTAAATPLPPSSRAAATALLKNGAEDGLGDPTLMVTAVGASSGGDGKSQSYHSSVAATAVTRLDVDDGGASMPDPPSAGGIVVPEDERWCGHGRPSSTSTDHHTRFIEPKFMVKRGRGRPPRKGRGRGRPRCGVNYHKEPTLGTHVCDPGACGILIPWSGKGGPPDDSPVLLSHGQDNCPVFKRSVLPRRARGRPRKCKPPMVTSDAVPADGVVHMLNFASPGDPTHVEVNGHSYQSWSLGDDTGKLRGEGILDCSAAPRQRLFLRLPRNPEPKPVNLSSLIDRTAVCVPKRQRTSIDHKLRKFSTTVFEERVSSEPLIQSSDQIACAVSAGVNPKPMNMNTTVIEERVNNEPSIQCSEQIICSLSASVYHEAMKQRVSNESLIQSSEKIAYALPASVDHKPRKVSNKLFEERERNEPLIQSSVQMVCALSTSVDHEPTNVNTTVFEERVTNEPLIQRSEQIVCALPAGVDYKPRKVSNKLSAERESNEPLIQRSEQMVCAPPACVGPLPNNITSSRPQIEGWVQVLLAVQPSTVNAQQIKMKKNSSRCNERKLFHSTDQFHPDHSLLTTDVDNMTQVNVKQSSTDGLVQAKADKNREHMERYKHPTSASALNSDSHCYFQNAEEENQLHVDANQESMPDAAFQVVLEENVPHDVEGGETVVVGHSVLDGSLQIGNVELRTQMRRSIELLPSEQFTHDDSSQTRLENMENTDGSKKLLATGLLKPEESLHREEEIMLHAESFASECLVKPFLEQELLENETHDDSLQSHGSANWLEPGNFFEEHAECSKSVHDLQSEKKNESHTEGCVQALLHEQAQRQDDFPYENGKNVTHATGCMVEISRKVPAICDSSSMDKFQGGYHDDSFNQDLLVEEKSPQDELQMEDGKLYDEKYILVPQEEQPECGHDMLSEAYENRSSVEECVLVDTENGPSHGHYLQIEDFEKGPEKCIESHADEGLQVFLQEQDGPEDDQQMEDDGSNADTEALALQLPLEKSNVCDFVQIHESENGTQAREIAQEPPRKWLKTEHSLQMEDNKKVLLERILQSSIGELSRTDDPLPLKREKNESSKKNRKNPRSRKLWFES